MSKAITKIITQQQAYKPSTPSVLTKSLNVYPKIPIAAILSVRNGHTVHQLKQATQLCQSPRSLEWFYNHSTIDQVAMKVN